MHPGSWRPVRRQVWTGPPPSLTRLWASTLTGDVLRPNGQDLAFVDVSSPGVDRGIRVTVDGVGSLQGFGSGNPITTQGYTTGVHSTFYGRAVAVVRAGVVPGEIRVTATATGGEVATTVITVEESQ